MGYAVVLTFDGILEKAVLEIWDQMERLGESLKNWGSMPHITLAGFQDVDPEGLENAAQRFSRKIKPINIKFSAFGGFSTEEHVIFLAPDPTIELLNAHQLFFDELGGLADQTSYKPGIWIPHTTIAMNVPEKYYSRAFGICSKLCLPISGKASGVEIIKFMPIVRFRQYPIS